MISNQILYDLIVHEEWSKDPVLLNQSDSYFLQKRGSLIKKFWKVSGDSLWYLWSVLATQLRYKVSFGCPPLALINVINNALPWRLNVSSDGCYVAILKDNEIEIRANTESFSYAVEKYQVDIDEFPQWRKLAWSKKSGALAFSNSFGKIKVFDVSGKNHLTLLQNSQASLPSTLKIALCHLEFLEPDVKGWEYMLYSATYEGILSLYNIRLSKKHFEKQFTFDFRPYYPYGISSVVIEAQSKLIFTAGCCANEPYENDENTCVGEYAGIKVWRVLSDSPYLSTVDGTGSNEKLNSRSNFLTRIVSSRSKQKELQMQYAVFRMCMCPDGKLLLTLHIDGRLSLWNVPSMKLQKTWHNGEQPVYIADGSSKDLTKLFDALWWSDEHLLLARKNGDITVTSTTNLENLLGEAAERFDNWPQIDKVTDGHTLVLECEKIIKEIGAESQSTLKDKSHWDVDNEDDGIKAKAKEAVKNVLYFLTEAERFRPELKNPKSITRIFRLVSLKKTTPKELFHRKIELEHFGEALDLAQQFDLNVDLVYQKQWRSKPVSKITINDYLSKIKDRYWVLDECLLCIPEDFDSMEHLLKYALLGTNWEVFTQIDNDESIENGSFVIEQHDNGDENEDYDFPSQLSPKQIQIAKYRWQILQFLDRLSTYEVMLGGSFKAREKYVGKFFKHFRSCNIVHQAIEFAQSSDMYALEDLFSYYGKELLPHWLPILSNIPETTDPMDINPLIPDVGDSSDDSEILPWQEKIHRDIDWVERSAIRKYLINDDEVEFLGEFIYEGQPHLKQYKNLQKRKVLEDWFVTRLLEIDKFSSQIENCSRFLELGLSRNLNALKKYQSDIKLLKVLTYKVNIIKPVSLEEFHEYDELSKIKLLMSKSSEDTFIKDYSAYVQPFLSEIAKKLVKQREIIVNKFLVDLAKTDLTCCLLWFESMTQSDGMELENLVENAYDCIMESKREDQLALACKIFECVAEVQLKKPPTISIVAQNKINELEHLLSAAKILELHSQPKTITTIKESKGAKDVSQKIIETIVKQNIRKPLKSLNTLLQHMITLITDVFLCVDKKELHKIFAKLLLNSGEKDKILVCNEVLSVSSKDKGMQKKDKVFSCTNYLLDYKISVKLIVEAASEYFNAALSYKDESIELARICLSLNLDKPQPIQAEIDLIEAMKILSGFNISLVPLQVRLMGNKLDIIDMCLQANLSNYKKIDKLLEVGKHLHICGEDINEQIGQIKTKTAEAAYHAEDYRFASKLCNDLMDQNYPNAWNIYRMLGEESKFADYELRLKLLNHAITFCPVVNLENILHSKLLLEMQIIPSYVGSQISQDAKKMGNESEVNGDEKSILKKTTEHTKYLIHAVTDNQWLSGAMQWMSLEKSNENSNDICSDISSFTNHPYYFSESSHPSQPSIFNDAKTPLQSLVIRMQKLSQRQSENELIQQANDAYAHLIKFYYGRDSLLCLAHAIDTGSENMNIDEILKDKTKTIFYFLFTAYFFSLSICSSSETDKESHLLQKYRVSPRKVLSQLLIKSTCNGQIKSHHYWEHFMTTCTKLVDLIQAQTLKNLDSSVDVERFAMDDEYKRETILGLTMSVEDKFIEASIDLSDKYDIPYWEVMLNFAEYLFTDSNLKAKEIRDQLNKWSVETALKGVSDIETKNIFFEHLKSRVYPLLNGRDHSMLLLFYIFTMNTTSPSNVLQGTLTLDFHIKLLKKLKAAAPGLNYKELVHGDSPLETIKTSVMESNVHLLAKLAMKIPRNDGTTLSSSEIFLIFSKKTFWDVKQPIESVNWLDHFNSKFKKVLSRLEVDHVIEMYKHIVYDMTSLKHMSFDVRITITKTFIQHLENLLNHQNETEEEVQSDECLKSSVKNCVIYLKNSLTHLTNLKSNEYMQLKSSIETQCRSFALDLDLTVGEEEKITLLYKDSMNQLLPLRLLSIAQNIHKKNIDLSHCFRNQLKSLLENVKNPEELDRFEELIKLVSYHNRDGYNDVNLDDILHVVEPLCCNVNVGIELKSAILHLLEKHFKLSKQQVLLLSFFQSETLINNLWQVKITQDDVETNDSRFDLFHKLLYLTSNLPQLEGLRQLMTSWPVIHADGESAAGEKCWCDLLKKSIELSLYGEVVSTFSMSKKQVEISTENVDSLINDLVRHKQFNVAMKIAFVSANDDVIECILDNSETVKECELDDELMIFILESNSMLLVANSVLYKQFITYIREKADTEITNRVINQLRNTSLDGEAGSLLLLENADNAMFFTLSNGIHLIKNSNIFNVFRQ